MKKDQNKKAIIKFMGSPLSCLVGDGRYPSWLFTRTVDMSATLIPRQITHIKVYGIRTDMWMDSQRQHVHVHVRPQQPTRCCSRTHHGIRASDIDLDLHEAARSGSASRVQRTILKKRDLMERQDEQGNLPLHLAVEHGHKEVALYLVEQYPQGCYTLNLGKKSPLYLAVVGKHMDLVESMFQRLVGDANLAPGLKQGMPILHAAIESQNKAIVKHQPDLIKTTDEEGRGPLSYAAYHGYVDIVQYLLRKYRELAVSIRDRDGSYPIHKACLGGHLEVLKMFQNYCPKSLLQRDQNGRNVLHLAAKAPANKLKHVVSYLLSLSDISRELINKEDENKRTPLALAHGSKNDEVVQLITFTMPSTH